MNETSTIGKLFKARDIFHVYKKAITDKQEEHVLVFKTYHGQLFLVLSVDMNTSTTYDINLYCKEQGYCFVRNNRSSIIEGIQSKYFDEI